MSQTISSLPDGGAVTTADDLIIERSGVNYKARVGGISTITSGSSGGIPYFDTSTSLASTSALTAGRLIVGGGAGAAPTSIASSGTTTTVLHGNASGNPSYGAVALGTDVSGTLQATNFPALSGDITTSAGSLATAIGSGKVTNTMLNGSIAASKLIGSDITVVGTIATGVWNGTAVTGTYGGTGVNNGAKTVTLGGNLTTSGSFNIILTATADTNVTLPTSGTLINSAVATLSSLTSVGTIATGTWNGTVVDVAHGGTGASSNAAYTVMCAGTTSTGALQNVASVGSSGQVLTSNGASALPSFKATGTWVPLASNAASNSASSIFTVSTAFNGTYRSLAFVLSNIVPITNNVDLLMTVSTDGGSTYLGSGYASTNLVWAATSTTATNIGSASTSAIKLAQGCGNGTAQNVSGIIYMDNPISGAYAKLFNFQLTAYDQTPQTVKFDGMGCNTTVSAINAIKFAHSSGNISFGTINLYGIV